MPQTSPFSENATKVRKWSWVLKVFALLALLSLWGAVVATGTLQGWFRKPLAPRGHASAFAQAAKAIIDRENRGNVAFVLLENGRIVDQHFVSRGVRVDADSLFQVASLSKWLTAWGVLRLADQGKIDLDAPVSRYLTRWKLPNGEFDESQVTVRRLLSHTAGLTDGLGYNGFAPDQPIQPLEASLTRASDADPGADGRVRVGARPGAGFIYSGGGYALLQLVIEEVSKEPFNTYMKRQVFTPLGMNRSSFVVADDTANVAEFFDTNGQNVAHHRFAAPAAVSLYTSTADLARFIVAYRPGAKGEPAGRAVLSPKMLSEMQRPHAYEYGAAIWGLGVVLYAPNDQDGFIIGHDGTSSPAINTTARLDPASGSGLIILETGHKRLATRLGGEWVFWKTGNVDLLDVMAATQQGFKILLLGALAIIIAFFFLAKRRKQPRRPVLEFNNG